MQLFDSVRVRTALLGAASALLMFGAAVPGAAASSTSKTINFTITSNNSVTNFVPCPAGTPTNVVECGYGANEPITLASNDAGDLGLTGTDITISFVSELEAPISISSCAVYLPDGSAITIKTMRGDIYLVSRGAYCASSNTDYEPFNVIYGTGAYAGATGSGHVDAKATGPQVGAQGFSADIYTGTITLAN